MKSAIEAEIARSGAASACEKRDEIQSKVTPFSDLGKPQIGLLCNPNENTHPPKDSISKESHKKHNAFKVTLKPGITLVNSIKKRLKEETKCVWDHLRSCYIGPIENAELAQRILEDRGNVTSLFIEKLPRNTSEKRLHNLWNKIEFDFADVIQEENAFLIEIHQKNYSESFFLDPPLEENKNEACLALEREFYARYQNIRARKKEIENRRKSAIELEKEKDDIPADAFLIRAGETCATAKKGKDIISDHKFGVFQRSGQVVRIIRYAKSPRQKNTPVKRSDGAFIITGVDETFLVKLLSETAKWMRLDKRSQKAEPVDFPEKAARFILSERGDGLPVLTGFICAPTLRSDMSILEAPGYDPESGLFLDLGGNNFPLVPQNPSKNEALKALDMLKDLLKDFRFDSELSLSVAIAEVMTSVVRRSLELSPAFGNNAPEAGSGKTLLADIASILATGSTCTCVSSAKGEEENRKRLSSALRSGDLVICIDNVSDPFEGDAMCTIITSPFWQERLLGTNSSPAIPTNSQFIFTGNNLSFKGDMCSRVVMCNIDPGIEQPGERKFDRDLKKYAIENRGELVVAILTIIRSYFVAGSRNMCIPTFRTFSDWSLWIRSPLVWLGMKDPYESTRIITEGDPIRNELGMLFSSWYKCPIESCTVKHLLEMVNNPKKREGNEEIQSLYDVLIELVPDGKGDISAEKLGKRLRECKGRIVKGFRLVIAGKDGRGAVTWRIVKV